MNKLKHFFMLTFSTLLIAFGTYFFKFTNNFTFGGITGLAVLIAKTGLISAGDFNFIASMILLIIGMFILGKKFAATTAYCSILLSVSLSVLERLFPMHSPFTDEPMLELCFAIALPALGSAILFNIGSSSGGTDIIAMILKKYSSFDIGKALLISDALITASGFFIFDIETGLFSLLGLSIRSFLNTLPWRDTRWRFVRAYVRCNHRSAVHLRNFIRENDKEAFILISNTSEIIGKGFHSV